MIRLEVVAAFVLRHLVVVDPEEQPVAGHLEGLPVAVVAQEVVAVDLVGPEPFSLRQDLRRSKFSSTPSTDRTPRAVEFFVVAEEPLAHLLAFQAFLLAFHLGERHQEAFLLAFHQEPRLEAA